MFFPGAFELNQSINSSFFLEKHLGAALLE
jgi:hypothetical protein